VVVEAAAADASDGEVAGVVVASELGDEAASITTVRVEVDVRPALSVAT